MMGATMEICRKKNEALKKFSGTLSEYQIWREIIVDHLCRSNVLGESFWMLSRSAQAL